MATEFARATLQVEDLESLLKAAEVDATRALNIFDDLTSTCLPKFQKRIEQKLYGEKMLQRVTALSERVDALRPRMEQLAAEAALVGRPDVSVEGVEHALERVKAFVLNE